MDNLWAYVQTAESKIQTCGVSHYGEDWPDVFYNLEPVSDQDPLYNAAIRYMSREWGRNFWCRWSRWSHLDTEERAEAEGFVEALAEFIAVCKFLPPEAWGDMWYMTMNEVNRRHDYGNFEKLIDTTI